MENPRPEKVAVVDEVRAKLSDADAAILTEYRGLKVGELATLRTSLRGAGGDYKVYKNTLVRFAARDLGLEELESMLTGPTAIAFVKGDAAAVAKALRDYSRTNATLVIKGGVLGTKILDARDTAALADLPSRDVLLAQLAGAFQAPLAKFAGLLQALPRNFAYGLKALIDQGAAAAPEPEALEPEAPAEASPAPDATAEAPETDTADTPAEGGEPLAESPAPDATAAATEDTTETENQE
jgi:large subunit ribosomal protein L10